MSCPPADPKEAEALTTAVKTWLGSHGKDGVVVKISSGSVGFQPVETHLGNNPTRRLMFKYSTEDTYLSFGFNSEVKDDWTTETAKKEFSHMALDKLPLPGFDKPKNWDIHPATGCSSFSEGVEWELFDVKNKRVKFQVKTSAYCIKGSRNDLPPIGCGKSPEGSYLHVDQNIPISLTVDLPIQIG